MKKLAITMAAILASASLTNGAANAAEPKVPASEARITMPEARATALKAHPGRITDAELERENGRSGLRYSFDMKVGGRTFEVGVDANNGAILEKAGVSNPD